MSAPADRRMLAFEGVSKAYEGFGRGSRYALRNVSFNIPAESTVAIVGRSGSGKSTLLHLAAALDRPTSGRVVMDGVDLDELSERRLTQLRRETVGLVFQFFHLLRHLSVFDNIVLPEMIAGTRPSHYRERALSLLDRVGLPDRTRDRVDTLSGGEMQRVAICRALLRKPKLLLADEPTGNLDDETSGAVMSLMTELAMEERATLVYVTHSRDLIQRADETWILHSGELEQAS